MNTPDFSQTTLEAAMANTLAAVTNNWPINVEAGRIDNSNPPPPPNAYVVGHFTDSTNSNAHGADPLTGTNPVCGIPPIPPAAKPYVPPVRNVPVGDTLPVGFIVTGPDGTRWQTHSSHTPFGVAHYDARLV